MHRRTFLKSSIAMTLAAELGRGNAEAKVPAHLWGNYDFGSGPPVHDRLNQGPFPQYPPDAIIPTDDVVMATTPTDEVVPNYGKGLITYITADSGTDEIKFTRLLPPDPSGPCLVESFSEKTLMKVTTDDATIGPDVLVDAKSLLTVGIKRTPVTADPVAAGE